MDDPAGHGRNLVDAIASYGSTIVAFSGGVDSAVVARAAREALGHGALAALSDSPTLPRSELVEARELARRIGIRFEAVRRSELDDPRFVANPAERCYFCKEGLVEDLTRLARERGVATVCLGVNGSDTGDWRPGIEAARTGGARFPLLEVGLGKQEVRSLARHWGLPVWDKPASPCLSSRIPYGQVVTVEKLGRIERAEAYLREAGFRDVRVRHMGPGARVEVPDEDVDRLVAMGDRVRDRLARFGFEVVELDRRGLVSGRLNLEQGVGAADRAE